MSISSRTLALCTLLAALQGCAGSPHLKWLAEARWHASIIRAGDFDLTVYSPMPRPRSENLHIYLGGDGQAFRSRYVVSANPTGTVHTGLQLALADPAPSLYLARPCYYTDAAVPPCNHRLWTSHRYSQQVVDAMAAALLQISVDYPLAQLTLVGYSGGGVLAMHIARRIERVSRVITIAAPLDTQRWTALHNYSPLEEGANPADYPEWPRYFQQVHLSGGRDENVPPAVTASFLLGVGAENQHIKTQTYAEFDHACCWLRDWSSIVAGLSAPQR